MRAERNAVVALTVAAGLFVGACSDSATNPTRRPGAASFGKGGGAGSSSITYRGQGFISDDGGIVYHLVNERCGAAGQEIANDGGTGQFANWNGAGLPYTPGQAYLVWVLSAAGGTITSATITLPDGPHAMYNVGGTFKYASPFWDYSTLVNLPVTVAYNYSAAPTGTVNIVVSHGCPGFKKDQGTWCSPGYWKNALAGAYSLIGVDPITALFNSTVVPPFYDTPSGANPTLSTVLNTAGANTFGAASAPYGLNAFNATGAYLTNLIPGYTFSIDAYNLSQLTKVDNCPIDHAGNFKP